MSNYRRADTKGGAYFFTVVSYRRQPILCDEPIRIALRNAIKHTQRNYPFEVNAWVLMPDHLHCIWTLLNDDANFSIRWNLIKRQVSIACPQYKKQDWLNASKLKQRESTIWQRRYWEHKIRNKEDYNQHMDYIHYNPVKHNLCETPDQWKYSTIHKFVEEGVYPIDWAIPIGNCDKKYGEFS